MSISKIQDILWGVFVITSFLSSFLLYMAIIMFACFLTNCNELVYTRVIDVSIIDAYICNVTFTPIPGTAPSPWNIWSDLVECHTSPKVNDKVLTMFNHFRGPKACFEIITHPSVQEHMFDYHVFYVFFSIVLTCLSISTLSFVSFQYLGHIEKQKRARMYAKIKKDDDV